MAIRKKTTAKKAAARKEAVTTKKKSATAAKTSVKTSAKTTAKPSTKSKAKAASRPANKIASSSSAAAQLKEYQRKRDFKKTAEPSGSTGRSKSSTPVSDQLRFVIQKHDATRLHYDLRLEMDGVMKSWAVPKGPSADPSVKRLAMQVEDHPIEYNTFEGTIPAGEYGGGTVMLWDNGTYEIEDAPDDDPNSAAHDEYARGEMKIVFHGKRIKGSYALVRTKGFGGNASKPSWLLIKHRDKLAHPESESALTEKYLKSVTTARTMDQISKGSKVWHSSR